MTDVIINGCCGKMGRVLLELGKQHDFINVVGGIDLKDCSDIDVPVFLSIKDVNIEYDVIIDFSHPFGLDSLLDGCVAMKKPVVIATTGLTEGQISRVKDCSKIIPIFFTFNMSLGINLLCNLVKKASAILGDDFDIEILEKHHNQKVDNPSGTALMIADSINSQLDEKYEYVFGRNCGIKKRKKKDIGIHAIRGGTYPGEHQVIFAGHDEILSISHTAISKQVFAKGALNASIYLNKQHPGIYDMNDLLK